MRSKDADHPLTRAAIQINFVVALMFTIPMTFVGFTIIRLAAVSFALEQSYWDPRGAVPFAFIFASMFAWIGWVSIVYGLEKMKLSLHEKSLVMVSLGSVCGLISAFFLMGVDSKPDRIDNFGAENF